MNEKDLYNKTIETIFKDIEELKGKLTSQDNLSYVSNIEDFKSHMSKYAESFDPNKKNEVPKELLEILSEPTSNISTTQKIEELGL